jgi:hypothetical protein
MMSNRFPHWLLGTALLLASLVAPPRASAASVDLLRDPARVVPIGRLEATAEGIVLHAAAGEETAVVAWQRPMNASDAVVRVEHGAITPFFRLLVFFRNERGLHVEDVTMLAGTAVRDLTRHAEWRGNASEIGLLFEPAYPGATLLPAPRIEIRRFEIGASASAPGVELSRSLAYEGWSGRSINILPRAPWLPLVAITVALALVLALRRPRHAPRLRTVILLGAALPALLLIANMLRQQHDWRVLTAARTASGTPSEIDWQLVQFAAAAREALAQHPGEERVLIDIADEWTSQRLRRLLLPQASAIAPQSLAAVDTRSECVAVLSNSSARSGPGAALLRRSTAFGELTVWVGACSARAP